MKKKNFQEIKNKSAAELQKDLIGFEERLRALKFDLAAGKVKNIREIRTVKKNIAQTLTIIKTKQKQNI
jgi:ribosomal protein L29